MAELNHMGPLDPKLVTWSDLEGPPQIPDNQRFYWSVMWDLYPYAWGSPPPPKTRSEKRGHKWEDVDWNKVEHFALVDRKTGQYIFTLDFSRSVWRHDGRHGPLPPDARYKVRHYKQAHTTYDASTGQTMTEIDSYHVEVGDSLKFCIKD